MRKCSFSLRICALCLVQIHVFEETFLRTFTIYMTLQSSLLVFMPLLTVEYYYVYTVLLHGIIIITLTRLRFLAAEISRVVEKYEIKSKIQGLS